MRLQLVTCVSVAVFSPNVGFAFQAGFRQFPDAEDNPAPAWARCDEIFNWTSMYPVGVGRGKIYSATGCCYATILFAGADEHPVSHVIYNWALRQRRLEMGDMNH